PPTTASEQRLAAGARLTKPRLMLVAADTGRPRSTAAEPAGNGRSSARGDCAASGAAASARATTSEADERAGFDKGGSFLVRVSRRERSSLHCERADAGGALAGAVGHRHPQLVLAGPQLRRLEGAAPDARRGAARLAKVERAARLHGSVG